VVPLLKGTLVTIQLTFFATLVAILLSFAVGMIRLSKYRTLRLIAGFYVEALRGTSLLVQLFWLYFALPMLLDIRMPAIVAAVLALGLNYGAYGSEVVRSSILAVAKGQTEACIALNMTSWQRLRRIQLPQAVVMMLPAFGNLQIELLKGTSLVYLITLSDLTYQGMILRTYDMSQTTMIFTSLLAIYFILAYTLTLGIRYLERRASVGRF
jgi:polar amino acid transport system permease protein